MGHGIEEWEQKLVAWFKEQLNVAMATIVRERYTIADARNRQKPREYAEIIIRAAKLAELGSTGHIIMLIYNGLDLEFQRDLAMPSLITPLKIFLQDLENHKDIWWGLAARSNRSFNSLFNAASLNTYRNARNLYYTNPYFSRGQSRFNNYAGPFIGRNNSYQASPGDNDAAKHAIEAPRPKLMIAAGPANESDGPSKQADGPPSSSNPFRPYYNRPNNQNCWNTRGGYNEKWRQQRRVQGNYFGDSKASDNQQTEESATLEETYHGEDTTDETNEEKGQQDSKDQEVGYYHDQFGYHIGTTIMPPAASITHCKNCSATFKLNNKLHAHLKHCRPGKLATGPNRSKQDVTPAAYLVSIPVIESNAKKDVSNGLAF
ncbi:hypothetical protein MMC07_009355 [Pseudocyphellaria aurata]|nr:hypothetical protein [Pseudocyphellaria aurata]